ncbi:hypothetical protein [Bradyrhizobium sp.]|uniref:hypothetical protein n=1 Tax=Bradyrhizobium sp. TaxID=376 RepID=UPI002727FE66|nr:hypothetical protein [Bradyrhizobium sp.]MDO9294315.1 hypothetical protein [Bradyrhizobium sp.]
MANESRFKSMVAIGATGATVAALLLGQIHLAYVIANEVAFCHRSATPSGLLAWHFGFAWPWLALLAFQSFGLHASRFFWLSVIAGGFSVWYAISQFEIIFVGGETIPKWECTDWSWYDETFMDRAFALFVMVPLLFLFALTSLAGLLLSFVIRITGVERTAHPHPINWALSKLARLIDDDAHRDAGQKPAEPKTNL